MKAFIWLTSIEVRHGESWIKGSGAAALSLEDARYILETSFPDALSEEPTYIMDAPSLDAGQRLEFTCRLLEPTVPVAMVIYGV